MSLFAHAFYGIRLHPAGSLDVDRLEQIGDDLDVLTNGAVPSRFKAKSGLAPKFMEILTRLGHSPADKMFLEDFLAENASSICLALHGDVIKASFGIAAESASEFVPPCLVRIDGDVADGGSDEVEWGDVFYGYGVLGIADVVKKGQTIDPLVRACGRMFMWVES